jgi:hypothetical protein
MTPEEVAELIKAVELPPTSAPHIETVIAAISRELAVARTVPLKQQRAERQARLKQLKVLVRALDRLVRNLEALDPNTRQRANTLLHRDIGRLLSTSAFSALLGTPVSMYFGDRDLESRTFVRRGGPGPAMEEMLVERRREMARRTAVPLLVALLRRLQDLVEAELDAERQNTGGSPGNPYRRHALRRLATLYTEVSDKAPTTTPGGPFILFCSIILPTLGLDGDGLEQAVGRELRILSDRG